MTFLTSLVIIPLPLPPKTGVSLTLNTSNIPDDGQDYECSYRFLSNTSQQQSAATIVMDTMGSMATRNGNMFTCDVPRNIPGIPNMEGDMISVNPALELTISPKVCLLVYFTVHQIWSISLSARSGLLHSPPDLVYFTVRQIWCISLSARSGLFHCLLGLVYFLPPSLI